MPIASPPFGVIPKFDPIPKHFSNKSEIQKSLKCPIGGGGASLFWKSSKIYTFLNDFVVILAVFSLWVNPYSVPEEPHPTTPDHNTLGQAGITS